MKGVFFLVIVHYLAAVLLKMYKEFMDCVCRYLACSVDREDFLFFPIYGVSSGSEGF